MLSAIAACSGGGGGGSSGTQSATPVAPANTDISPPTKPDNNASVQRCPTVSAFSLASPPAQDAGQIVGRITYERVPFIMPSGPTPGGPGLDYDNSQILPARGVVVEAVKGSDDNQCTGTAIAATLTDGDGWYRLAPGETKVCVRARAQLYRAADTGSSANWNFAVADNTSTNALYNMIETAPALADAQPRRDLHASSGWSGGGYNAARVAAPFAILDTACTAMNAVLDSRSNTSFGALTFMWSTKNTNDTNGTREQGKIGGAFFDGNIRAIYLRGDAAVNTDEFDHMVIAHEFGHFVVHVLSRSDSIGGDHSLLDYLDPRVAFDEGWATAFAGLALNDPIYRDSDEVAPFNTFAREFSFDIRQQYGNTPTGWFSEMSAQRVLYRLGQDMSLGKLLQTFASPTYKSTGALASIFSYGDVLIGENPSFANNIASLLADEQIDGYSIAAFAENEDNDPSGADLPVYELLDASGSQRTVCSLSTPDNRGTVNKLSNRRYLRFTPPQTKSYTFSVMSNTGGVPGVELIDRGRTIVRAEKAAPGGTLTANSNTLQGGRDYVLSVFHVGNVVEDSAVSSGDQCFKVWVQAL